ncbi:serologically defined colon cancer antigen 8 isoform X2 [Ascaphus truei]|uniref:serologically defined colon cancer antigen 8 isoform X2 n=1 Tax=Ascaphus truei TaxID=8439 RepID=UPI003F59E50D
MNESWDFEVEESLEGYQRGLRERASSSIQQLKQALEDGNPSIKNTDIALEQLSVTSNDEKNGIEFAMQELQRSHAVNQLKALLREHGQENEASPRRRKMSPPRNLGVGEDSLVSLSDLVPMIQDQSQYIHHLEAEVKFCKDDLSDMKQRVRLVVLENDELHNHLKSKIMQNVMKEQTLLEASTASENSGMISGTESRMKQQVSPVHNISHQAQLSSSNTLEQQKWQLELEKQRLLHQTKTETLESQVMYLRKDLSESQKNYEDLRRQLKQQDFPVAARNSTQVRGLCLKCPQNEALLAQTHTNVHMQTIERLTKERDELMDAFVSMRENLITLQQRESNAYEQVKQSVEMTEEANLEKTKALVNCEQLRSEMERKNARLEKEVVVQLEKMAAEKEAIREKAKKEREELSLSVMDLSQNVAMLEGQLERVRREKDSLAKQLEESQKLLSSQEVETTQVCGEMRYQLTQTQIKKDEAEKEHREYRIKTIKDFEIKDQEIEKLWLQLIENKQRMEQAQQDATRAKDECLRLTELLGKSEHQLHLARLKKDVIQHSLSSEIRSVACQAQQWEQELKQKMQQMEAQHDQTVDEMDSLMTSQNTLISKLKKECHILAKQLGHITEKNRSEIQHLIQENVYVHNRSEKHEKRQDELEAQCIQHGTMHKRMKTSLQVGMLSATSSRARHPSLITVVITDTLPPTTLGELQEVQRGSAGAATAEM